MSWLTLEFDGTHGLAPFLNGVSARKARTTANNVNSFKNKP